MNVQNTSIYGTNWCTVWYSCATSFNNTSTGAAEYNGILFTLPSDFEFEVLHDPTKTL